MCRIAVEFALVLPTLLLFRLDSVKLARAFFVQNDLLNTVPELARRPAAEQLAVQDVGRSSG